jgi:Ser/Thr protein kinase RdoA (MazF antagonist)
MEQRIRDRFSSQILDQTTAAFGIKPENIQELGGFESFIYEFDRRGEKGILRITHDIRRTPEMILAELDWINHLKSGGAGVAGTLEAGDGNLLVKIPDQKGGYFLANAFEKASGNTHRGEWPTSLLFEYGRQIGLMHQLTMNYLPADPSWMRPAWDDPSHLEVGEFIPADEPRIREIFQDVIQEIRELPKQSNAYGLIHQDAHQGNFFVDDGGSITFFDFDDSSYSWLIEDIALVLFYAVMGQDDPVSFTKMFLDGFLPGYFSANHLDLKWFEHIPLFMKRRELDLYAVIHRSFDVENLDDPWCIWYLEGRKQKLENGVPYLDFDFGRYDFQKGPQA